MDQIICDTCGEPIDQAQPFYTGSISAVQRGEDNVLTSTETPRKLDYHIDHLPGGVKV